ncbi:D-tyrosyl-tRNA(Tyr) deacylase [Bifidobacterium pseudolongum subsp. globosum]|uniref:D-aminoacyl-tRNA deacylase n=1 Tax=Bifidobacterium pseudolongum subsp. globosum TaxID=1690 RepID=A0A2N3QHQ7_9BIFI|nr:D-aminoacyl-tRNA deacylase [Bifidobacterium pseudolongum]PKU90778.1 D-tyrosyl-tRNA(Tyr) deacylase [Bifidobacterium pseudolongum subsp. globosum]
MRIVLQKVSQASVDVVDEQTGELDTSFDPQSIGRGFVLLVGFGEHDEQPNLAWLAAKIAKLRVFEDADGKMNRSIRDVAGEVLSVPQFTLYAQVRHGNRPSFTAAMEPTRAREQWMQFNDALRAEGLPVQVGRFGAHMRVSLTNDGPVTILFDGDELGV